MPYKMDSGGRMVPVKLGGGPKGMGCPGGCGPGRGMGAATGSSNAFGAAKTAAMLNRAEASALGVGARIGDRAARYAVQVVRRRGLAGMGDLVYQGNGLAVDASSGQQAYVTGINPDGTPTQVGQVVASSSVTQYLPFSSSGGGAGPSSSDVFGGITTGLNLLSTTAGSGINAYRQFTGQAAPVRPATPSAPWSTSTWLAIGGVVVVGLGTLLLLSRRKTAAVKANRRRANRHGFAYSVPTRRRNRYFVKRRAA